MMANPEGTQQLRDRDLEFMFYDEAQVRKTLCCRCCCCCGRAAKRGATLLLSISQACGRW